MEQSEKDRIAAEIAADYRNTIRETAEAERRNRSASPTGEKSMGLAYFFWFSFGGLGAHRFYLGYPLSGAGMLILGIFAGMFSLLPFLFVFGYLLGVALMVWWLADAFLIPRMIPDVAY
jgi:TM2 domain-containing membrane protein YozV